MIDRLSPRDMKATEEEFWVVWNPEAGPPSMGHLNENTALAEAERLAKLQPGARYFILQAKHVSQCVVVNTTPLKPRI